MRYVGTGTSRCQSLPSDLPDASRSARVITASMRRSDVTTAWVVVRASAGASSRAHERGGSRRRVRESARQDRGEGLTARPNAALRRDKPHGVSLRVARKLRVGCLSSQHSSQGPDDRSHRLPTANRRTRGRGRAAAWPAAGSSHGETGTGAALRRRSKIWLFRPSDRAPPRLFERRSRQPIPTNSGPRFRGASRGLGRG